MNLLIYFEIARIVVLLICLYVTVDFSVRANKVLMMNCKLLARFVEAIEETEGNKGV